MISFLSFSDCASWDLDSVKVALICSAALSLLFHFVAIFFEEIRVLGISGVVINIALLIVFLFFHTSIKGLLIIQIIGCAVKTIMGVVVCLKININLINIVMFYIGSLITYIYGFIMFLIKYPK